MNSKGLRKIRIDDVSPGVPVEWTLFDEERNVLVRPGYVFKDQDELAEVFGKTNLFRAQEDSAADAATIKASRNTPVSEAGDTETTLDEIGLHIGESWQLQPVSEFDQKRYYVKLVGYMKGVSVIVTTPMVDGKSLLIRDGQPFIVRAFSGKSAYAFKTSVIKTNGSPFPYLHLDYPDLVSGMIVRQNQRIVVSIIASITPHKEGAEKVPGMIKNVSKSGVSLLARGVIGEVGDQVSLSFQLCVEDNDYLIVVDGILRAVRAPGARPEDNKEYGIQFVDVRPIDHLILTAYCNSLIANAETG